MANHPRYQRSLDELFLHVYVYIDDWLEPHQDQLPKHPGQKASISELLTIAVVGELLAQPFESTWYWVVQQRFGDLFPSLPEYSRYHRVLRNAEPLLAALALSAVSSCELHLIDSKPLPIAKGMILTRLDWVSRRSCCQLRQLRAPAGAGVQSSHARTSAFSGTSAC